MFYSLHRSYGLAESLIDDDAGDFFTKYQEVHKLPDGSDWTEDKWGEGVQSGLSHVYVTEEVFNKLPPMSNAERQIIDYDVPDEDRRDTSRLGVMVTLTKDLEGAVFYAPDQWPTNIP